MKLPSHALTNLELEKFAQILKFPYFIGVFSRNDLPRKINLNETAIVNLDISSGEGTHWVAYVKRKDEVFYFDSYGDLRPPKELVRYFLSDGRVKHIYYNYTSYQKYNSYICGHLCLMFIYNQFH